MSLLRYLRLIASLKWTLALRWIQRSPGGAIASGLALLALAGGLGLALLLTGIYLRAGHETDRDLVLAWILWLGTLSWLFAPLSQVDAQRNLDLSALRLLPVTRPRFTLAVLLDGILSPLGLLSLLAMLGSLAVCSFDFTEQLLLLPTLLLLGVFQLGCAQSLFLFGNRVFNSRRFGEISMALGLVLFMAVQMLNLLLRGGGQDLPPWLFTLIEVLRGLSEPLGRWLAPGLAVNAFSSAVQGWWLRALQGYGLLALQSCAALLLCTWAARLFYEGDLESGGKVQARKPAYAKGPARFAGHWHGFSFPPLLTALLQRERDYLWRDPLVKMQLLQSLFGSLYIAVIALMLNLQQGSDMSYQWLDRGGRYILLGIALMLGLSESAILFNKFGYEGGQLANLLVTPVSRRLLLASKSLHLVGHFLPLNLALALMAGLALRAPALYLALALLLVITSTLLLDLIGNYISIYYPFSYRRVGRRLRAVMPQPGCGYVLVYLLVFQLCHALTMPLAALNIALALLLGWPGLLLAVLCSAGAVWAGYRYGLDDAERRLAAHETRLLAMLERAAG